MPPKGYSLMRSRRRYSLRNENWFTITRFSHPGDDALTNPSSKELERQEFYHSAEAEEKDRKD